MIPLPCCRVCGQPIPRDPSWSYARWRTRGKCSVQRCPGRGLLGADYPGAILAAEVPAKCVNCSGPWRRVDEGVGCILCGRRIAIKELLVAYRVA